MYPGDGLQVLAQAKGIVRLAGVIQLLQNALAELLEHALQVDGPGVFGAAGEHPGRVLHDADVGLHLGIDVGALHLDHDGRTVVQCGPVHLGCGSRRKRLGLEAGVQHLGRLAQLLEDDLACHVTRKGGNIALQQFQLLCPFGRNGRGLAGNDLAHLDVGRAQFLEQQPHFDRGADRFHIPG